MYLVQSCQWLEVIVLAEVQHQSEQTEDLSVEAELQEEPVVVFSHTVIDPGNKLDLANDLVQYLFIPCAI